MAHFPAASTAVPLSAEDQEALQHDAQEAQDDHQDQGPRGMRLNMTPTAENPWVLERLSAAVCAVYQVILAGETIVVQPGWAVP